MKKETIHNLIIFVVSILILAGIAYGGYYFIIGRDGLINKINTVENEFDKTEVLETFTELVKEKYMAVYNEIKEDTSKKLEDFYNTDIAISYLAEKGVLEYYYYSNYDEASNKYTYVKDDKVQEDTQRRDNVYYINVENIEKVNTYGKGAKYNEENKVNKKDVFLMEKKIENDVTTYFIKYFDQYGKAEEVGSVELANPLIK